MHPDWGLWVSRSQIPTPSYQDMGSIILLQALDWGQCCKRLHVSGTPCNTGIPVVRRRRAIHIVAACAVEALQRYLTLRGNRPGYLYCWQSGAAVSRAEFSTVLNSCLVFCGLDTSVYKSHSFRIGAARHAVSKGFSDAQIRVLVRWHSDGFNKYIRC